jgi:hypothetical protein
MKRGLSKRAYNRKKQLESKTENGWGEFAVPKFTVVNNTSWDECHRLIALGKYDTADQLLSQNALLLFGDIIKSAGVITYAALLDRANFEVDSCVMEGVVEDLVRALPVLDVILRGQHMLADVHSLDEPGWFLALVDPTHANAEQEEQNAQASLDQLSIAQQQAKQSARQPAPRTKPEGSGRQKHHLKWPTMVAESLKFIKGNSFHAHERRRTTELLIGVTLIDIQRHLYKRIPGLLGQGVDVRTIRHLMLPPKRNIQAAARYLALIDAKIPAKRKDLRKQHVNGHFSHAAVKLLSESLVQFPAEAGLLSADRKSKTPV